MKSLKTIVVPTDCGPLAERALRYADRLASAAGAGVLAVYGEPFSAPHEVEGLATSLSGSGDVEWMMRPIRQRIDELLAGALSSTTARKVYIADAPPAEAILDAVERYGADLVVMTPHSRSRFMRAMLGSNTEVVLAETKVPLLIFHDFHTQDSEPIRRVLCPFRDSPASSAAVTAAATIARAVGATIELVHLVGEEGTALPSWLAAGISGIDHVMRELPLRADAGRNIVGLSSELAVDLLVLGTSHRRFADDSSSAATFIIAHAPCPTLSVTV